MSNLAVSGRPSEPSVAELHQGTQVLYRWGKWQDQHALGRPLTRVSLRKGGARLVVYSYGASLCGVLEKADTKPKVRNFREWRQPIQVVVAKLVKRGWALVPGSEGVSHDGH